MAQVNKGTFLNVSKSLLHSLIFLFILNICLSNVAYSFSGTVIVKEASGSLVRFDGDNSNKAIVLTNGHNIYVDFFGSYSFVEKPIQLKIALLNGQGEIVGSLTARRVIYSTMSKTDLAILELEESYEDIEKKYGIKPLVVSREGPVVSEGIEIISSKSRVVYQCVVEELVPKLIEGAWVWNDSIRYSNECKGYGGMSGAPVISRETGMVIGIHNTSAERRKKCQPFAPCEVWRSDDGEVQTLYKEGTAYAQNVHWIYSCINEKTDFFSLDFSKKDCLLEGPRKLTK